MSLQEKIGQLLVVGIPGPAIGPSAQHLIKHYHVGGVILFRKNVESPAQVRRLTAELQHLAREDGGIPLVVAIDHEGGTNTRFDGRVTPLPTPMALGATRSPSLVSEVAHIAASELGAMGVNANLAPVLDVNDNPLNPIIGLRSFGESPQAVAELGTACIRRLQQHGVIATAKHFPGHGSTSRDSHLSLPVVHRSRAALEKSQLMPFRSAVAAGVGMIMTAHVAFPGVDGGVHVPSTLSPIVVDGLLRRELGYDGVVISDDMGMRGITDGYGPDESAVMAVQAGVDLVLMAGSFEQQSIMYRALLEAVGNGTLCQARIDASVARILRLKRNFRLHEQPDLPSSASIGSQQSAERAAAICERAVTVVKNSQGMLPLNAPGAESALVVSPSVLPLTDDGTLLGDTIRRRGVPCAEVVVDLGSTASKAAALRRSRQLAPNAAWLLVGTWQAGSWQAQLVRDLLVLGKPLVAVAFGTPYDLAHFADVATFVAAFGNAEANVEAVAKVIFGELCPVGTLPVSISGLYEVGHGLGFPSIPCEMVQRE